jgi:hypothetical protein
MASRSGRQRRATENMSIAQVGNASNAFGASGTSPTFSGLDTTSGNVQVIILASGGNTTDAHQVSAMPAGCARVVEVTDTGAGWIGVYLVTSSLVAGPSFTMTSVHSWAGVAIAFSGATGTVDVSSGAMTHTPGTAADTSTAVTPTASGDLLVAGFAIQSTISTVTTPPAGYTEATPTGGAVGSAFVTRAYYLLNPALSAQQPAMQWGATAPNGFYAAYVALTATAATAFIPYQNYQRAAILAQ